MLSLAKFRRGASSQMNRGRNILKMMAASSGTNSWSTKSIFLGLRCSFVEVAGFLATRPPIGKQAAKNIGSETMIGPRKCSWKKLAWKKDSNLITMKGRSRERPPGHASRSILPMVFTNCRSSYWSCCKSATVSRTTSVGDIWREPIWSTQSYLRHLKRFTSAWKSRPRSTKCQTKMATFSYFCWAFLQAWLPIW